MVAYMAGQHSVDVNLIVQVDVSVRVCPEDWFFMFESWRLWHAVAPSKRLSNAETREFAPQWPQMA